MSLLLIFIVSSCNKEEAIVSNTTETKTQESQITFRSTNIINQKRAIVKEIIGCYDRKAPILNAPTFEATYGNLSDLSILYTDVNGANTYVYPLISKNGLENSIMITERDEIYFLKKDQFLTNISVKGTEVPQRIDNINHYNELMIGNLDIEELRKKLVNYRVSQLNKNVMQLVESKNISNTESTNGIVNSAKLLTMCEAVIFDMVPLYAAFFGLPQGYDPQLLFEAIVACHPSGAGTYCVCPIPSCVEVELFRVSVSKGDGSNVIDLNGTFTDCFGPPDQAGNYIDCSMAGTATFELTLYADQPTPGSRDPFSGVPGINMDVGHTFVSLATNFGGVNSNITFGFYPQEGSSVNLNSPIVPMDIYDDGGHEYHSSATISLTCDGFNQAMIDAVTAAASNDYDLNDYNCTDFGIEIANNASLGVTDSTSPWVYLGTTHGASSNPGDLGEDILLLSSGTSNTTGAVAPDTDCP